MGALKRRVRRLETRSIGTCAVCGGAGRWVVTYEDGDEKVEPPAGCPCCGKAIHIRVQYVDGDQPGYPGGDYTAR